MEVSDSNAPWPPQSQARAMPDQRIHRELHELNLRFLELVARLAAGGQAPPSLGLDAAVADRIARLRAGQRGDLARCPYALPGIRLHEEAFWAAVTARSVPPMPPLDEGGELGDGELGELRDFLFLTLAWHWHLAQTAPAAARWMLGATAEQLGRLTALPFGCLRQIAVDCPGLLEARLAGQRRFWEDLVGAAEGGSRQARFAATSLGLQLSAAAGATRPKRGPGRP